MDTQPPIKSSKAVLTKQNSMDYTLTKGNYMYTLYIHTYVHTYTYLNMYVIFMYGTYVATTYICTVELLSNSA